MRSWSSSRSPSRSVASGLALGLVACAGSRPLPDTRADVPRVPPTASAASADPSPPVFRLPDDARPRRYDLDLWVDPDSVAFRGRVGVDLDVARATRTLWLNSTDLGFDAASLEVAGGAPRQPRVLTGDADATGFAFDEDVPAGRARLTVTFHGTIDRERSRGIYAAKEPGGESYAYTFFEAIDSRRAFPSFDEPAYKVPWKVTLHVPAGDVALANARVASETPEGAMTKAVAFEESQPLPSYLVAFVVGPFDVVDGAPAGHLPTPLRFVVPRGRKAELAYAQKVTPRIVGLLEDYFGIPYPYGKLDVAVVPRYWGSMEHPGLVALGQPLTLIAPAEDGLSRERSYADIAIHELGHYWFGDYVTTAWWDDTWLNEALTTWIDAKISHQLEPRWRFDLEGIARMEYAMPGDALESAKKIRQPVSSKAEIESSIDITYFKGQAVFGMFEAWMTPDTTRDAVRAYLTAHAWKSATSEDLFAAFETAKPGAGDALRTFVDQPGLPIVSVTPSCDGGKAVLAVTQRRYRLVGSTVPDQVWKIPVCIRYGTEARGEEVRACILLAEAQATIPLPSCPSWVEPNADGKGYYHAALPREALAAALEHANDGEKLALLRDAAALVESGDVRLGDVLGLTAKVTRSSVAPVFLAGTRLSDFALAHAPAEDVARFDRFLARTYGPVARGLGLRQRAADAPATIEIRRNALAHAARRGADASLRAAAHAAALSWLTDDRAIDPEMRWGVLAIAASTDDPALFDALVARASKETDKARLGDVLDALGAFAAPDLVARADALVLGRTIDLRDSLGLLRAQLEGTATRDAAWTFLRDHFDALASRMRSDDLDFTLSTITLCDDARRREVEALGPAVAKIDGAAHALAKTVERIGRCAALKEQNRASLEAFLASSEGQR